MGTVRELSSRSKRIAPSRAPQSGVRPQRWLPLLVAWAVLIALGTGGLFLAPPNVLEALNLFSGNRGAILILLNIPLLAVGIGIARASYAPAISGLFFFAGVVFGPGLVMHARGFEAHAQADQLKQSAKVQQPTTVSLKKGVPDVSVF